MDNNRVYGYIEKLTYQDEDTGFTVARLKEKGKKELTTIVGNMEGISPGESVEAFGRWVHNKKHGVQFQVESFKTITPTTVKGIEKYLGSGLIKGIGPVTAKRIVSHFQEKSLEVIDNAPENLSEVEGIGPKRVEMISKAWEEQKEIRGVMIFLQSYNIGASHAVKIFKEYGDQSIQKVKENPYCLASDIRGIGFITADKIASSLGVDPESLLRVKEGIIYVLNDITNDGHVYYPYEHLVDKTVDLLAVKKETVVSALEELSKEDRIVIECFEGENIVYLSSLHTAEINLSKRLIYLKEADLPLRSIDLEKAFSWVEEKIGLKLAEKQREAVGAAVQNKVLVITGGPGTGKTTITKAVIEIYKKLGKRVILTAPTGRAAKKMQEATGHEAKTIHRLLEFNPQRGDFAYDQNNPLPAELIIVDEASMIDITLMYNLTKSIPEKAILVLVGDIDQLPSVGPGSVLRDIINSGNFKVITLKEIFRQSKQSKIVTNAHMINQGRFPDLKNKEDTDFFFIKEEDPEKMVSKIVELCRKRIPKKYGFCPKNDIQVLSPMHKGVVGVQNLNVELQNSLNPSGKSIIRGARVFRLGDKVMQVVNNYNKDVYNGDIGEVVLINDADQEMEINFGGRKAVYDYNELEEVVIAYAASIHKAQGSEFPAVILTIATQHYILLERNLIYTGITRGKKLVVLVGTEKAVGMAVKNNKPHNRYTLLSERLAK